jgi:hypothetical protein
MAAQIKRKTGIDPLTVDQVGGSYNPREPTVDPVFDLVSKSGQLNRSLILHTSQGEWLTSDTYHGRIDLTVFHPVQKMIDGRPDWLRMNGYRMAQEISNKDFFAGNPTLVQAFLTSESGDGLPVDQVLLESAEGNSTLLLPAGVYRLQSQTCTGFTSHEKTIEIRRGETPD